MGKWDKNHVIRSCVVKVMVIFPWLCKLWCVQNFRFKLVDYFGTMMNVNGCIWGQECEGYVCDHECLVYVYMRWSYEICISISMSLRCNDYAWRMNIWTCWNCWSLSVLHVWRMYVYIMIVKCVHWWLNGQGVVCWKLSRKMSYISAQNN